MLFSRVARNLRLALAWMINHVKRDKIYYLGVNMGKTIRTVAAIILLVVITVSTVGCAGESTPNTEKTEIVGDVTESALNDASDESNAERGPFYDIEINSGRAGLADPVLEENADIEINPDEEVRYEEPAEQDMQANNLMEGIEGQEVRSVYLWADYEPGMTDFALRLAKACNEKDSGQNVLVSPLSVLLALSMTANGAEGKTLNQMEEVLGFSIDMLNAYAHLYKEKLNDIPSNAGALEIANSIWFLDDSQFIVNKDFLQTVADYYDAEIYSAPFDQTTVNSINTWVSYKTKRMIPTIIDNLDPLDLMALINAVSFDGKWLEPYKEKNVKDGEFHVTSDKSVTIPFMYGNVSSYLSDDKAQGFIKEYIGRKYAFAALLPEEGIDVYEYLNSLSGEHLRDILLNAEECLVSTSIPKFESDYDVDLKEVLKAMGLGIAFTEEAEFGKIGKAPGNICLKKALHKTFISVYEDGTKAGAVTAVMAGATGATPRIAHEVYLDRPFIYMLIDIETKTPFFIGVLNDPKHS